MFGRLLCYLAFLQLFLRKKKPKKILEGFRKKAYRRQKYRLGFQQQQQQQQ